ncbi:MAG: hypothetical protein OFPI_42650 [Osedax symbiont Rs2]|nr:MAG: hypothetical protein OFPI_42650 [Osedax symbiont Rs2]
MQTPNIEKINSPGNEHPQYCNSLFNFSFKASAAVENNRY